LASRSPAKALCIPFSFDEERPYLSPNGWRESSV
jgi:hypothetical protein